jgi:hypothetical protein
MGLLADPFSGSLSGEQRLSLTIAIPSFFGRLSGSLGGLLQSG